MARHGLIDEYFCALCSAYDCSVPAHGKAVVKTGLSLAIPAGTYARVAPRSGLAVKHFIDTGAGVVDEDYRGEVGVVLFNHSDVDFPGQLTGQGPFLLSDSCAVHMIWRTRFSLFTSVLKPGGQGITLTVRG